MTPRRNKVDSIVFKPYIYCSFLRAERLEGLQNRSLLFCGRYKCMTFVLKFQKFYGTLIF